MNIEYRKANMNDLNEICELVNDAIKAMTEQNIMQWDEMYPTKEDFYNDIAEKELYIGTINNEIVVIYVLNQECDDEYKNGKWRGKSSQFYVLHRLCVKSNCQNRGIAKRTLLHIEQELKLLGTETIRLDVFSENPYALKLYSNLGYSKVGEADWRKGRFYLMEKYIRDSSK